MLFRRVLGSAVLICLVSVGSTSCLARRRAITRRNTGGKTAPTLLVADKDSLIAAVAREYNAVRNFSATVDMTPARGSVEKNQITEYKDVTGYILFRKPNDIRLIGLYPLVHTTAFDMTSNGIDFKLYLPSKNLFMVGKNELTKPSTTNTLENLRPQHFEDAMLVRPIDPGNATIMENLTDEDSAHYILHEIHVGANAQLFLRRTIWFNRLDLQIERQIILDDSGNILTDARYSDWKAWDNVPFPKHLDINRPKDDYGVVLDVVKMDINKGVADYKFVLEQPEGTTLKTLGQPAPGAPQGHTE